MEILTDATHSFRGEGLEYETGYGVNGGGGGAPGRMHLRFADGNTRKAPKFGLESTGPVRFVTQSPGGGGWGDPLEREPGMVLRDFRDGIVSAETMRETYGVVAADGGRAVDEDATGALRAAMRNGGG